MGTLEKVYALMFILIAVFIILTSGGKFNTLLGGAGGSITRIIIALQGGRGSTTA